MKPIADVVNAISGVINGVTLPAREKKELQAEILRLVYEREREMIEARAGVIRAEAAGNWLQRSWRPLVMLIFAVIVLIGTFTSLPMLSDTSRFWDLLEIGLGGDGVVGSPLPPWRGGRGPPVRRWRGLTRS